MSNERSLQLTIMMHPVILRANAQVLTEMAEKLEKGTKSIGERFEENGGLPVDPRVDKAVAEVIPMIKELAATHAEQKAKHDAAIDAADASLGKAIDGLDQLGEKLAAGAADIVGTFQTDEEAAAVSTAAVAPLIVPPGIDTDPAHIEAAGFTAGPEVAPANPLDSKGRPWDARIHAATKTTVKDGTWKIKRGVDKDLVAQIEATLGAVTPPAVLPETFAAIPETVAPVTSPAAAAPPVLDIVLPAIVPPVLAPAGVTPPTCFAEFMVLLTAENGKYDAVKLNAACVACDVPDITHLGTYCAETIARVWAKLTEAV